ncbi:hypothetical protein N9S32_01310 [Candidatus Actinomarina]|nr:hypothetical protein [Candidatus Actinomarina sp.]
MFEIIAKIISRNFKNLVDSKNPPDRNKQIIQIILWTVVAVVSLITYAPRDLNFSQVLLAIGSFFMIIYFAIRTLKYFKII